MGWFQDILQRFFGRPASPAAELLKEMKAERGGPDAEWTRLRGRLATLVLSESDQQRLWRRAHRGADGSARLLSGITRPTADERARLADLVAELERGR